MVQATAVLSMPFPTSSFVSTLPPVTDALVKILTEHGHSFNNRSRARICEGHVGEARLRFPWIWTGAWDCRAGNNMNRSLRLPIAAQLRRGVASTWSAGHINGAETFCCPMMVFQPSVIEWNQLALMRPHTTPWWSVILISGRNCTVALTSVVGPPYCRGICMYEQRTRGSTVSGLEVPLWHPSAVSGGKVWFLV